MTSAYTSSEKNSQQKKGVGENKFIASMTTPKDVSSDVICDVIRQHDVISEP